MTTMDDFTASMRGIDRVVPNHVVDAAACNIGTVYTQCDVRTNKSRPICM